MVNWSHRWFQPDGPISAADVGETFAKLACDGLRNQRTSE
jgi:hypothetical protein